MNTGTTERRRVGVVMVVTVREHGGWGALGSKGGKRTSKHENPTEKRRGKAQTESSRKKRKSEML